MRIGFIGLGKLGYPVALAMAAVGQDVIGYDVVESKRTHDRDDCDHEDPGEWPSFTELRKTSPMRFADTVEEACKDRDVIFVAAQTPHEEKYDGTYPLDDDRADFDYQHVEGALLDVGNANEGADVVLISTVLPGTIRRLFGDQLTAYNPYFIAMGTVIPDFFNPEFILVGADGDPPDNLLALYEELGMSDKVFVTDVAGAEMIKVAYNTYIGMKLAFINTYAMVADRVGADVDDLTEALSRADRRIISTKYLRAGMGDGGACHPRDNIAMSWFAREYQIPDFCTMVMEAREQHAAWLNEKMRMAGPAPYYMCGEGFKANIPMKDGSPARLMARLRGIQFEDWDGTFLEPHHTPPSAGTYFISCAHDGWKAYRFPNGSTIVDPWGMKFEHLNETHKVVRPGRL